MGMRKQDREQGSDSPPRRLEGERGRAAAGVSRQLGVLYFTLGKIEVLWKVGGRIQKRGRFSIQEGQGGGIGSPGVVLS